MGVNDICADKNLIAVAHQNGALAVFKRTKQDGPEGAGEGAALLLAQQFESPLMSLKLTADSRFLAVFCQDRLQRQSQDEDEHIEYLAVYDFAAPA